MLSATWETTSLNYHRITEGEVVGIAFGWIIAVVLFYIIGLLIIIKFIPKRQEDEEGKSKGREEPYVDDGKERHHETDQ